MSSFISVRFSSVFFFLPKILIAVDFEFYKLNSQQTERSQSSLCSTNSLNSSTWWLQLFLTFSEFVTVLWNFKLEVMIAVHTSTHVFFHSDGDWNGNEQGKKKMSVYLQTKSICENCTQTFLDGKKEKVKKIIIERFLLEIVHWVNGYWASGIGWLKLCIFKVQQCQYLGNSTDLSSRTNIWFVPLGAKIVIWNTVRWGFFWNFQFEIN